MRAKPAKPGTIGELLQGLRAAMGMSQDDVAAMSDGAFSRTDYQRVEAGRNTGAKERWRGGMARAFRVSRDDLADYLDRRIALDEIVRRSRSLESVTPTDATVDADSWSRGNAALALEAARRDGYADPFLQAWEAPRRPGKIVSFGESWGNLQAEYASWSAERARLREADALTPRLALKGVQEMQREIDRLLALQASAKPGSDVA